MQTANTFSFPHRTVGMLDITFEQLCARAGVAPAKSWSTADFFRLWLAAEAVLADRAAGLRFGREGIARGYGVAALVALHAPDFRTALAALSRYKRLTCPEIVDIDIAGDEVIVRYRWLQAEGNVPRLLVDMTMASLMELARHGTAGKVAPIRVELSRRRLDQDMLRGHFKCPVMFNAEHDAMVFRRSALEVPFATADGGAFARIVHGLEHRLVKSEEPSALVGPLRLAIARQMSEGRSLKVAATATRLGLSLRTLQRRLDDAGTSFQQQLADVRRITAKRLLANTDFDTVAIAMLLGFTEPNSFARAFRVWEQTSPLRWRDRHADTRA